jgi:hypothetical protein
MPLTPLTPKALVAAPERVPHQFGLFSVIGFRTETENRWTGGGIEWEAGLCGDDALNGIGQPGCPPGDIIGLPLDKDVAEDQAIGSATPFTVYGGFSCSPVGYDADLAQARATANLLAGEEARVERAYWSGDLGNDPNLVEAASVVAGPLKPAAALGALEDALFSTYAGQGTFHTSRRIAYYLAANDLIENRLGRLVTALGTPVVAGAGYPGTKPTAGAGTSTNWLYIAPPPLGYRSDIFNSSDRAGDLLDRSKNNLYAVAERTYAIGHDPCGVFAVEVNIT